MNDKSRDKHAACGPYALGNLSNNKFLRDYYNETRKYLSDNLPEELSNDPSVQDLRHIAEQEFINYYNEFPTCAVFAPGRLTIAGENISFVADKSLSMAIQLVTVIVGKRIHGSKWCHAKTLSDEVEGQRAFKFYMNTENLDVTANETSWIRYVKGTLQSFKAKRGYVPGFKIIVISSVPIKGGLGSSSALVVATYTFLEAITNNYTSSTFEKALACCLAERIAIKSGEPRLLDTLIPIIGRENKMYAFDARSLRTEECDWNPMDVKMVLVRDTSKTEETRFVRQDIIAKEYWVAADALSRWHPDDFSMVERLIPWEILNTIDRIAEEAESVPRMIEAIRGERWKELGKLLRRNDHSARKYMSSLAEDIERLATELQTADEVFSANVISYGYGASLVALVRRSRQKSFIYTLKRIENSRYRCCIAKASMGASTLYAYEDHLLPWNDVKRRSYHRKLIRRYYLRDKDDFDLDYYSTHNPSKSISLFIPRDTLLD